MNLKMKGNYVHVRRCFQDHVRKDDGSVLIYRPEGRLAKDETPWYGSTSQCNWVEIIALGPDCEFIAEDDIGGFCRCPEYETGIHRLEDEDFAVKEDLLYRLGLVFV